jgi:N-methylhydantoinase A
LTRRIGIDIGGTFTDITVLESDGGVWVWKEDSTPDDPGRAIRDGLHAVAQRLDLDSTTALLEDCDLLVHGSTIATNTVIERNGVRVGLICTRGFRDSLYLRDGFKPDRFNRRLPHPQEFAERFLRLGVRERVNSRGEIVMPLVEDDVRRVTETFRAAEVGGVAVALLWSIVNPRHEQRVREIVEDELPGVPVVISSDVLPEIREWERTSATVLSTYVLPRLNRYMREFEAFVTDNGLTRQPLIMQINGGCATVDRVLERPVAVIGSGPAAAPAAANYLGAGSGQRSNYISVDMGGTSFDVCLIRDGAAVTSKEMMVEDAPIGVPGVEVHSVGAGGGSIAWIDAGGALQVGPHSAGARPGPACYGRGGEQPTVTDANLVLGYLGEGAFLGGRRTLDKQRSIEALERHVATSLGLDVDEAAAGVHRIVNSNMVNAIRAVSVQRGIDPRGYVLVSGGGAGGIHIGHLAAELGVREVLIPEQAGLYCAFGMTVTDVRHDLSRHVEGLTSTLGVEDFENHFSALEEEGRAMLAQDGFGEERSRLVRSIDARYPNQVHELSVEIPSDLASRTDALREVEEAFHAQHERLFKYAMRELPVQILHWRVAAFGLSPPPQGGREELEPRDDAGSPEPASRRSIYLHERGGFVDVDVFRSEELEPGATVLGPAVVEGENTTIVVFEDQTLEVGRDSHRLSVKPMSALGDGFAGPRRVVGRH